MDIEARTVRSTGGQRAPMNRAVSGCCVGQDWRLPAAGTVGVLKREFVVLVTSAYRIASITRVAPVRRLPVPSVFGVLITVFASFAVGILRSVIVLWSVIGAYRAVSESPCKLPKRR